MLDVTFGSSLTEQIFFLRRRGGEGEGEDERVVGEEVTSRSKRKEKERAERK